MAIETTASALRYGRDLLVGERVRLRALDEDDVPQLEQWWEDPEQQPLQQGGVRPRPAGTNLEMFSRWSANTDPSGAGFSIEALASGVFVGHVTMWGAKLPERAAHLAIQIGPQHVGAGYGSDAVRVMVRYGFLQMGLNRIQLEVWSTNDRARRAYARAGFTEEGVRRQAGFQDGAFIDEVVMAVLRDEWRDVRAPGR